MRGRLRADPTSATATQESDVSDLILLKFDDTYGAQAAMNAVRALEELDYAWMEDVAVVERHHSGRTSTHTTHGSVSAGAAWGGLTGMLVGLLWPPVGFLAWWAAGMGVGALIEKATKEAGLDSAMLDEIKDSLDKGQSALLLIGAAGDADEMTRAFEPYHPIDVLRRPLPEQAVANLQEALGSSEAPTDEG